MANTNLLEHVAFTEDVSDGGLDRADETGPQVLEDEIGPIYDFLNENVGSYFQIKSVGLTSIVLGHGRIHYNGATVDVEGGTLSLVTTPALTLSATNYIEVTNAGAFSINTSGFVTDGSKLKVCTVTMNGSQITGYSDKRTGFDFAGTGIIGGSTGSVDNAIMRANGTGGTTLQSSALTIDDNGALTVPEIAAPSTPASGKVVIYAKADGAVYAKDDAGTETALGVTGAGTGDMLKSTYDSNDDGIFAIANGGTGASTAAGARTGLGLGSMATQAASAVAITGGAISGITDLAIADGGTGASSAAAAFTALKQAASETATGVVELATVAEAETGTDTTRAVTPAGLAAAVAASAIHTHAGEDITSGTINENRLPVPTIWDISGNGSSEGTSTITRASATSTEGANVIGRRARGTIGSPTAAQSGDLLQRVGGAPYGATGYGSARAFVDFLAAENATDSAQGAYTSFSATPAGSTTPAEVARLTSAGLIVGGTSLNASALLQLDSTTKGLLIPRMTTTQRDAISSPATGLLIFNTTTAALNVYASGAWGTVGSGGGGTLADGDYGDVTVSGTGTVITIDADAVTYAKMQNVSATDMLLGRSTAGAGNVEEIPCTAAGRAILDDATAADQRATLGIAAAITGTKLDDLTAPDDNTDLNATTSAHGLLKKLSNAATEYMDGTGNWSTPAGGGGSFDERDAWIFG